MLCYLLPGKLYTSWAVILLAWSFCDSAHIIYRALLVQSSTGKYEQERKLIHVEVFKQYEQQNPASYTGEQEHTEYCTGRISLSKGGDDVKVTMEGLWKLFDNLDEGTFCLQLEANN